MSVPRPLAPRPEAEVTARLSREVPQKAQRYVSVACTTCRKKRVKCNGDTPCRTCRRLKSECVYLANQDGRRSGRLTRRNMITDAEHDCLEKIRNLVKGGNETDIAGLVDMIQRSESLAALRNQMGSRPENHVLGAEHPGESDDNNQDGGCFTDYDFPPDKQLHDSPSPAGDGASRTSHSSSRGLDHLLRLPSTADIRTEDEPELAATESGAYFRENVTRYQAGPTESASTLPQLPTHNPTLFLRGLSDQQLLNLHTRTREHGDTFHLVFSTLKPPPVPHPEQNESDTSRKRVKPNPRPEQHHHQCLREQLKLSKYWHPALAIGSQYEDRISCTCWRYASSPSDDETTLHTPHTHIQTPSSPECARYPVQGPSARQHSGLYNGFGNLPGSSAIRTGGFSHSIQEQQMHLYERPEWSILPLSFDDGSPFCRAYVSYIDAAQAMVCAGTPLMEIFGSDRVNVDMLFRPQYSAGLSNVSSCASSLIATLTELELAARMGWVLSIVRLMKWMIAPSAERYANLSILERPSLVQIMLPHSATIDFVPRQDVRDALCRRPRDFITPAHGCSINWPKRLDQAVEGSHASGPLYTTSEFQNHVLDISNWTYSTEFVQAFPELRGTLRVA